MKKLFQDQFGVRKVTKFPNLPDGCVKQWKEDKKKAKSAKAAKAKKRSKVLSASLSPEPSKGQQP